MRGDKQMARFGAVAAVLALASSSVPLQAQETFGLYGFVGANSGPGDFDVERSVEYGGSILVGGGVRYTLTDFLALRGDVSWTRNSGDETGAVNEPVDFDRIYSTVKLELSLPTGGAFSPYVFAGGGLVSLERSANDYSYGINETALATGLGARFDLSSRFGVFVEGVGSLYPRNTVGGNQFDKAVVAGASYTFR